MRASVPVRTCDIGGWTDTWFGAPGRVVNIAVSPGIEVTLAHSDRTSAPPRDRLVKAALDEYPPGIALDVRISSGVPAGSALGTSSAVAVALIGALNALRGEMLSAKELAAAAHHLETEVLGEECGVQDQAAAVNGGISYITVDDYPDAEVEPLPRWPELGDVLSTVYLGRPHASSQMHREVITRGNRDSLEAMRVAAGDARAAVLSRNLVAFADAVRANAEAQSGLHPEIVSKEAATAMDVARSCGALAWKVNGAGGEGGSLAVVHASTSSRAAFEEEVEKTGRWRALGLRIAPGGLAVEVSRPRS